MPKLSVLVTFCNQQEFITQALDSITMQKTNYEYEVLIGLDNPDDESKAIINEYLQKYTNFKLFLIDNSKKILPKTYKASLNRINLLKQAQGEYFCILDGDDFYSDNKRFQKLIDHLEERSNIVGVACEYEELDNDTKMISSDRYVFDKQETKFDMEIFIEKDKYIHPSCFIFHNIFRTKIPDDLDKNLFFNSYIVYYMLRYGDCYYIPVVMLNRRICADKNNDKKTKLAYEIFENEKIFELVPSYRKNFCKFLSKAIKTYKELYLKDDKFSDELNILNDTLKHLQGEKEDNSGYFAYHIINFKKLSFMQKNSFLLKYAALSSINAGGDKTYRVSYNKNNVTFSDTLSLYILQRLFGVKLSKSSNVDIYASGASLSLLFEDEDRFSTFALNSHLASIWGSGFSNAVPSAANKKLKKVEVYALRGALTKAKMTHYIKQDLGNITLGDPCILANKLLDVTTISKKYKVGILASPNDKIPVENVAVDNIIFINGEKNPMLILEQIASCHVILSTSVYFLMVADGLNIPNKRLLLSDNTSAQSYMFDDYYSAYGISTPKAFDLKVNKINEELLESIKLEYENSRLRQKVLQTQDELIQSFPK